MDFQTARKVMVDSQVRVNDVTDRALQAALLAVPREALCAPDRAFSAYAEVEVPVTARRSLMLPRDLSKLLMAAAPKPGERALVMSGAYAAAVLAQMGLDVTLQESDAEALAIAAPTLSAAGVTTVEAPLDRPQSRRLGPDRLRGRRAGSPGRLAGRPEGRRTRRAGRAHRPGRQGQPAHAHPRGLVAPAAVRCDPAGAGRTAPRARLQSLDSRTATE